MEKITRILVMSDTHGLRQDEVTKIIENEHCDYNIIQTKISPFIDGNRGNGIDDP